MFRVVIIRLLNLTNNITLFFNDVRSNLVDPENLLKFFSQGTIYTLIDSRKHSHALLNRFLSSRRRSILTRHLANENLGNRSQFITRLDKHVQKLEQDWTRFLGWQRKDRILQISSSCINHLPFIRANLKLSFL